LIIEEHHETGDKFKLSLLVLVLLEQLKARTLLVDESIIILILFEFAWSEDLSCSTVAFAASTTSCGGLKVLILCFKTIGDNNMGWLQKLAVGSTCKTFRKNENSAGNFCDTCDRGPVGSYIRASFRQIVNIGTLKGSFNV
jgi:hypothetical protein